MYLHFRISRRLSRALKTRSFSVHTSSTIAIRSQSLLTLIMFGKVLCYALQRSCSARGLETLPAAGTRPFAFHMCTSDLALESLFRGPVEERVAGRTIPACAGRGRRKKNREGGVGRERARKGPFRLELRPRSNRHDLGSHVDTDVVL